MPKLTIKARLGTCGRCGGKLGNPLTHVCVTRMDRPRRRTRTRIRPKVSVAVKCKTCGKPYANPVTHVCTVKKSTRRKLGTAARPAKPGQRKPPRVTVARPAATAAPAKPASHPYQSCRDADCERRYCVIWREARAEGYADGYTDGHEVGYRVGHQAGYREGYRTGYDEGYAAGQAASS